MTTIVPVMIPIFLEQEHDPVDWGCKNCGHSWKKHKFGKCTKGIITKCGCKRFQINEEQVEKIKKKLKNIEEKLFEDYTSANTLEANMS